MALLKRGFKALFLSILIFIISIGASFGKNTPQELYRLSEEYYNKAVASYKQKIRKSNDSSGLYFELGRLYFDRGEYELSVDNLKESTHQHAKKYLALAFYHMNNFADALEVFNRIDIKDNETYYYLALTCERLNLFGQALKAYRKIKGGKFKDLAARRIDDIEKEKTTANIKTEDPEVAKIITSSADSSAYPQAGALILLAKESVEVIEDGALESNIHYLIKILNERGKEGFAESLVEYDSTFEKVELIFARTIKPDGSIVYVGSKHIRDVSKYMNFPLYSNARVFIISFPEVAIGSVLEYKVRIKRSQLVNKKDFFLSYPLKGYEPVIASEFRLIFPKDKDVRIKFINMEYNDFGFATNPLRQEEGKKLCYLWKIDNVPQIIPEPSMSPEPEINPTILISTFADWRSVYEWWQGLVEDKIKPDIHIKNKVRQLIRKARSDEERAKAIYNFCAKDIRYVAVEYGQAGYEPHAAADIFKNKYGDCKDQSVLLVTMLREAGLSAFPALISTKGYYDMQGDFPSGIFNHCIVALYLKGRVIFLDPTVETCSFGDIPFDDQGRKVMVFQEEGYLIEDSPLQPPDSNLIQQKIMIKVNNDESIYGEKINLTKGVYDQRQRYWLLYAQPELIKDTLKSVIQDLSIGGKLEGYSIENLGTLGVPVILRYSFSGPEYFIHAGKFKIMPQLSFIDTSLVAKESRRYPVDLGFFSRKEFYLEVALPDGLMIKYMPDKVFCDTPWFTFTQEYSSQGNKILFKQISFDKKERVSNSEYANFKKAVEGLALSLKQRVILEKLD
jgi:cellulose synthase operon protein C